MTPYEVLRSQVEAYIDHEVSVDPELDRGVVLDDALARLAIDLEPNPGPSTT